MTQTADRLLLKLD